MYLCPHCQQPGIKAVNKLCSVSFAPATCQYCKQASYLPVVHGLLALLIWIVLTWIFIGVAIVQQMSIYLIGTLPALILAVDMCMLRAPMRKHQ